jgi:hypothetical protein
MWDALTRLYYLMRVIWSYVLRATELLMPKWTKAKGWQISTTARLMMALPLLALILIGLYFVNDAYIAKLVSGPTLLARVWLPVVFVLVLAAIWAAWAVWKLLSAPPEVSHYPDIDAAWDQAVRALGQAGIRVGDLPLFLVLGRPQGPEEPLFNAAQVQLVVKQTPSELGAPLHVYASRDAIYVTCAGASLLGKHAANVALEGIQEQAAVGAEIEGEGLDATIRPGAREKRVIRRLARTIGRPMNVLERRAARRDLNLPMPDLLKNTAEVDDLRARLAHLCRLILRDRLPLCPLNGILVLLPIGGTDTDWDAQQTAELCGRDLATIRRVLKLQCPILTLTCDAEAIPGFQAFIGRLSAKDRLGRLGQRFPLDSPGLAGDDLQDQIDKSVHFLCNSYLRDWVYRSFQMASAAQDADDEKRSNGRKRDEPDGTTVNTGLYLFLDEMRGRKKTLSRILTQGVAKGAPLPLLYAGCYLGGTGAEQTHEQAFVAGVFRRLLENQSYVSWTEEALAEDAKQHTYATWGYSALGGFALLVGIVAVLKLVVFK